MRIQSVAKPTWWGIFVVGALQGLLDSALRAPYEQLPCPLGFRKLGVNVFVESRGRNARVRMS
jgi:hypothetical protein